MQRLQAYKFELRPNGEQQRQMRRFAGACRFVFNKALAWQSEQYAADKTVKFSYTTLANLLPLWKQDPDIQWLKESPSQPLQQALKDLERAYQNFFAKRTAFPRFKKKGQSDSFRYPQGFKIDEANGRIFLPKLGWMRYRKSRDIEGAAKNITVSCVAGKWHVSIQTEREVEQPRHPSVAMVGIDVGIAKLATLSDGTVFKPVNSFAKKQARLARYQRAMARKVKFSNNWKKAKGKITKLHSKIGHIRRDYLHKTTTAISKNHAMVVIEDLQVRNMSKSASGTADHPGKNVRAKSGLNRSILDQGWFEFRRQLEFKQLWLGGDVLAVNPRNTSRTCPCCGHVSAENRQTQARFLCVECGYENNADVVGALNILARGHAVLRGGARKGCHHPTKPLTRQVECEGQDMADASVRRETVAQIACVVNGAVRPSATGTHRSASGVTQCHA